MATPISDKIREFLEGVKPTDLNVTSRTESSGASVSLLGPEVMLKSLKLAEELEDDGTGFGSLRVH